MADTRKDKRAPVSLKVRFKSATVDEFIEHYSKDVSRGGLYIKTSQPMPVGTLLKFQFQLKDESALIRGVGRVVWTRIEEDAAAEQPAGMGIKFIKMDNESRAIVERIVDSHADERGMYESGRANATSAEPSSSPPPSGSFFPDLPPAELPSPEDRTAVRHATEFIAKTLEGGSDEDAAREAQRKAEEARKRSEEIEAQRREEAEAKKRAEAEARAAEAELRASVRPQPMPSANDDEGPTLALPSMIIDPSLEPRAGRASEQTQGSEVTPLPRPHAVIEGRPSQAATQEPDTEPPPAEQAAPVRSPTTSIPQVTAAPPQRSPWPYVILAAVLIVGAVVFFLGRQEEQGGTVAEEQAAPEPQVATPAPAEPAPAPEPAAPEEAVADAQVAAAVEEPVKQEVAPSPAVQMVAVEVSSAPRGAEIWVGDEKRGVAPITVQLPSGVASVVRAMAPGFSETREEITPIKKQKLGIKLKPLPYVVHVETTPAGALVAAGAFKGTSPTDLKFDTPPTGQLGVLAKLDGYQPNRAPLKLDQFSESDGAMRAQLNITLQPNPPAQTAKEAAPVPLPKEKPKKAQVAPALKKPEPTPAGEPAEASEAKPEEPKPEEPKPTEVKPAEANPAEPKADESKSEPKPSDNAVPANPF